MGKWAIPITLDGEITWVTVAAIEAAIVVETEVEVVTEAAEVVETTVGEIMPWSNLRTNLSMVELTILPKPTLVATTPSQIMAALTLTAGVNNKVAKTTLAGTVNQSKGPTLGAVVVEVARNLNLMHGNFFLVYVDKL